MKKTILILSLILSCGALFAQQTLNIHSPEPLTWQGKAAMGGYSPEGTLQIEKALLTIKDDQIIGLVVAVDMTTLSQENKRLEGHLRDADFFDVAVFPQAVFTLTKPIDLKFGGSELEGVMSIKNNAQTEVIPAQISIIDGMIVVEFNHKFDRTDYGITYNSPSVFEKLKDQAIADEFSLKGKLSFAFSH